MQRTRMFLMGLGVAIGLAGCASPPKATLRFHEQVTANLPVSRFRSLTIAATGQQFAVDPHPAIREREVAMAKLEPGPTGDSLVLQLDEHGANLLLEMTTRLRGRHVVVLVNDRPVAAVLVVQPITNGLFQFVSDLPRAQMQELISSLNQEGRKRRVLDARP